MACGSVIGGDDSHGDHGTSSHRHSAPDSSPKLPALTTQSRPGPLPKVRSQHHPVCPHSAEIHPTVPTVSYGVSDEERRSRGRSHWDPTLLQGTELRKFPPRSRGPEEG